MCSTENFKQWIFNNQNVADKSFEEWLENIDFQLNVLFNTLIELKDKGIVNRYGFELFYDTVFANFRSEVIKAFKNDINSNR